MYELSPDSMCKKYMAGEVEELPNCISKLQNWKQLRLTNEFSTRGGDGWIQSEVILNTA